MGTVPPDKLKAAGWGLAFSAIVAALIVAGSSQQDGLIRVVGFVAVALAAANVVGGFVVTDRMLEMFKKKPTKPTE